MPRLLFALMILLLSTAGCATTDLNRQRMQSMPEHYAQFDAMLAWQVSYSGPDLVIDGYFRNVRYLAMDNVEIWVAAIDHAGRTVARSASFLIPFALREDDIAPFTVKLHAVAPRVEKLRFTYKYRGEEGAGPNGGDVGNWMQSFDAEIPPPQ